MNFAQKSALLKLLYNVKGCKSFVETGTYEARMTLFMTSVTGVIRSIELSSKLCAEARAKVGNNPTVVIVDGDSNTELVPVLADPLVERPLIWLDAHWSDGKTVRSANGKDTPIVEELTAIKACGKSCVVVIDDIRCFDGNNGYPTLDELRNSIAVAWPDAVVTRDDDAIWFEVT
jgi:hypothetical protein